MRLSKGTAMLIPQGTGPESSRAMDASKEDDFVQKAFSAITHKEGLPEQPEASQVCRPQLVELAYLSMMTSLLYDYFLDIDFNAW